MIFVTLGSQKFQFNRLLKEIDRLIESGSIKEKVFAQTGYSDYEPKYYEYKKFLDREDFSSIMESCDKVITHGGTGAIIGAIKKGKKVIAVPRLSMFGEHVDDHQLQIIKQFKEMNFSVGINEICELEKYLVDIDKLEFDSYISNTQNIINEIDKYIEGI
ncbi:MAG: PssE/Cps14G family polysaccharide biosynthesis glycosyltransferase [Clostridium sp.]|uniref:PssE/Cps14G family polysaccharide biosynthesis glycosyltransferase n=1 Tax=Clostridium sp. TaxID=1506 RepID=UPI003999F0F5